MTKTNTKVFYPVIFTKEDSNYLIDFPDIPEIITFGESIEDALIMAQDALGVALADEKTEDYPIPTPLEKVMAEHPGEIVNLISVDLNEYRKKYFGERVKTHISIPVWLKQRAKDENINISEVTTNALKDRLGV